MSNYNQFGSDEQDNDTNFSETGINVTNFGKHTKSESEDYVYDNSKEVYDSTAFAELDDNGLNDLPGQRMNFTISLDKHRHSDLIDMINYIKDKKNVKSSAAIREIMYYGIEPLQKLIKERKYHITPAERAK